METKINSPEGHEKVVALLIQHGSDVNSRNNRQDTPLYAAVRHGGYPFVNFMNFNDKFNRFIFVRP